MKYLPYTKVMSDRSAVYYVHDGLIPQVFPRFPGKPVFFAWETPRPYTYRGNELKRQFPHLAGASFQYFRVTTRKAYKRRKAGKYRLIRAVVDGETEWYLNREHHREGCFVKAVYDPP